MSHGYADVHPRQSLAHPERASIGSVDATGPSSLWPRPMAAALAAAKFAGRVRQAARRTSWALRGNTKRDSYVAAHVLAKGADSDAVQAGIVCSKEELSVDRDGMLGNGFIALDGGTCDGKLVTVQTPQTSSGVEDCGTSESTAIMLDDGVEASSSQEQEDAMRNQHILQAHPQVEAGWEGNTTPFVEQALPRTDDFGRADDELQRLKVSELHKLVKQLGPTDEELDVALDAELQKDALIALVKKLDKAAWKGGARPSVEQVVEQASQAFCNSRLAEEALVGASTEPIVPVVADQSAKPKTCAKPSVKKRVVRKVFSPASRAGARNTVITSNHLADVSCPNDRLRSNSLPPQSVSTVPQKDSPKGRGRAVSCANSCKEGASVPKAMVRRRASANAEKGSSRESFHKQLPYTPEGKQAVLPGKPGDRHVFWTGGYDSTWRIMQALVVEGLPVVPIYLSGVIDNYNRKKHQRRSNDFELAAMQTIRDEICRLDPVAGQRLRELVIVPSVFLDANLSVAMGVLQADQVVRRSRCQYGTMAQLSTDIRTPIDVSIVEGDKLWNSLQPYLKFSGKEWLVGSAAMMQKPELGIFRWLRFPLVKYSKESILEEAKERGLEQIMQMTWSCWFPVNGAQCGKCAMCKHRIV